MIAPPRPAARRPSVPILIVDDNAADRLGLKAVLAPLGYAIVEADSGFEALRCVMAQDFAVILLDVRMPVMDGFETASLIRKRRRSEMTPIIFITAHGQSEVIDTDRYPEGAVDFIFAPIAPHELRAKVAVFADLFTDAEDLAARARDVQASADQLRLLTDAAPIGIFQTDEQHRYVYTNPRWSEITGIPAEKAVGVRWGSIITPTTRSVGLAATDLDPAEHSHRVEIAVPGAAPRIVVATSTAIPDGAGGIAGWVGTLADVTVEVEAEATIADARDRATEASSMKSDFLANMSHEIRTPMNGVIGMTDLLLETGLNARQRDYARTVRNSAEALLGIINDILDFSKVEAGMLEIEDIGFELRTVIHHVVDLMAGAAQAKGLELLSDIDNDVPAWIRGDPGRLRQVLTNLIGNAVKFAGAGEIIVRVARSEGVDADPFLRFEVSDTGDGIAPERLAQIFKPYAQADTSTSRKYGGTGLGLTISSHLVSLMGGECGVSSRLGEGSEFWFTMPERIAAGRPSAPWAPDPGLIDVTALVVDDSAAQRRVLSHCLSDLGMSVRSADSGPAALAMLRTAAREGRPFAVALLDQAMPDIDGVALWDLVVDDRSLDVGLVLMCELGEAGHPGAVVSNVSASLSKPIHREDLRMCLALAVGARVDVTGTQAPAVQPLSPPPGAGAGAVRLLLAEDNLINQKVAVAMLSSAGYIVDTVPNGAAAVRAAAVPRRYDAILMDCQMPEMNGYEATAAIRALEGPVRHTPIIAMTAGARSEDRERCLSAGMDSYLAKPISKETLLALVARSLIDGPSSLQDVDENSIQEITMDTEIFDELRIVGEAADADFLSDLVAQFIHDTEPLLAQLSEALESGDAEAAGRIAHSIKGSCIQLGGRRLALSCDHLQSKATSGHLPDTMTDLHTIEIDYEALCRTLTEQLAPADAATAPVPS